MILLVLESSTMPSYWTLIGCSDANETRRDQNQEGLVSSRLVSSRQLPASLVPGLELGLMQKLETRIGAYRVAPREQ